MGEGRICYTCSVSSIDHYLRLFSNLNRGNVGKKKAPHKPVLLLALIDAVQDGEIISNRIYITPSLVGRFMKVWAMLVEDNNLHPRFYMPFYHLSKESEPFWRLAALPGKEAELKQMERVSSLQMLQRTIDRAEIDEALFMLMLEPKSAERLRAALLDYFPVTKRNYLGNELVLPPYLKEIKDRVLGEPEPKYEKVKEVDPAEEKLLRSAFFEEAVKDVYNNTCAITGMRITITPKVSMVDACHIIPFSTATADTYGKLNHISNGIALCPNLHRAFDSHLVSITDDYRVMMKKQFTETETDYSLKKLEGKPLLLPRDKKHWPARENLEWHRKG